MIVRNESAVIGRCLDSVRPFIDRWVICDTGSTDGTPELIAHGLDGIPGSLHHREWVDFGHNRSELMALARGTADYLLLVDADHELRVEGPRPAGGPDVYLLRHNGSLRYMVPRLVRGDRAWRFIGSTHEFLDAHGPVERAVLDQWSIDDHADGGSRGDKLDRDRRLLTRDLERDPDNGRTVFYLAQTLRDLGDDDAAVDMYARRVEIGGWDEEVFYAQYQRGALLARHDWDAAVPILLDAWQRRPQRAEPLYELALGYRNRGAFHLAYQFARSGEQLPLPDDVLFVHHDVYEHLLAFELAIAAYWIGHVAEALTINDRLLRAGVPEWLEPWVLTNRQWCLHQLDVGQPEPPTLVPALDGLVALQELVGGVGHHDIDLATGDWPTFNPSIAADGDGFRMIVRSANYVLEDGRYLMVDGGDTVRTQNYVVRLDHDGTFVACDPIPAVPAGPPTYPSQVHGVEDCRIVELDGRWFSSGTVRDRNPAQRCEIALMELSGGTVTQMHVLESPRPARHEKNWMPFVHDGALHFLYMCAPTIVLRVDADTGAITLVVERDGPIVATGFRGGSQGLELDDGYLFVVHEVGTAAAGTKRAYAHRVIRLDRHLELVEVTPPFCFRAPGIEFCAGLAMRDDQLLFSVGIDDRTAHVFRAPLAAVLARLEPAR